MCLLDGRNFYSASVLYPARYAPKQSTFIDSLIEVRQTTPLNAVLRPDEEAFAHNPVARCTSQPFVFPAVSERPWVDVIVARNDCLYEGYLYGQYGITKSQQIVAVQPRLLPGMAIVSWPNAWARFKSSYETIEKGMVH